MDKPAFTETTQIGIVVRDLNPAIQKSVDDYGIEPRDMQEVNSENAKDHREYGKPVQQSSRIATAMIGHVQWELIQPLDDESILPRFLAEKGGGVHHIAVAAPNFEDILAMQKKRGKRLPLSGEFSGVKVAYLPTDQDLGVLLEIFKGDPKPAHV